MNKVNKEREEVHSCLESIGITSTDKEKEVFELFKTPNKFQPKQPSKRSVKRKYTDDNSTETNIQRPRTPSGQVLTASVEQIKSVLPIEKTKSPFKTTKSVHGKKNQPSVTGFLSSENVLSGSRSPTNHDVFDHDDSMNVNRSRCLNQIPEQTANMSVNANANTEGDSSQNIKSSTEALVDRISENLLTNTELNPETMDVRTVIKMLEGLKLSIKNTITEDVQNQVQQMSQSVAAECTSVAFKASATENKSRVIVDTMHGMAEKVRELQQKIEYMEVERAKKMVILSGFDASDKKYIARQQLNEFFEKKMQVEVFIEDFYYIGSETPREIVLMLLSTQHKKRIFQQLDRIKNLVNARGKKYSFRDFLTAKQNEERKKNQNIADRVQKSDPHKEIVFEKGKLYIGPEEYTPLVTPPDPTSVLQLPIPKLDDIMSTPIEEGTAETMDGNTFKGYSIAANTAETIQNAYMKIRLSHAGARHIICAYVIPGLNHAQCMDHCDDEDYGASYPILQMMIENDITHRAIFIVRKCGKKLRQERNKIYNRVAVGTLNRTVVNKFTRTQQRLENQAAAQPEPQPSSYAAAVTSPPKQAQPPPKRGYIRRGRGNRREQEEGHIEAEDEEIITELDTQTPHLTTQIMVNSMKYIFLAQKRLWKQETNTSFPHHGRQHKCRENSVQMEI